MSLLDVLRLEKADRVFMLGMAKNAGKTFTLNHLVRAISDSGEKLGLTSTGRDGEPLDLVTGKAKPRVFCPKGTIVASAHQALAASTALLENGERTGIETVLGEVSIVEVGREGYVEIAGPLFAAELERLLDRMAERGARWILVDGSLDRKAAGRVVRNLVLAVGAVVSRSLDEVVEKAVSYVEQLSISAPPPWLLESLDGIEESSALLHESGSRTALPFPSLLGRRREIGEVLDDLQPWGLYVAGALGEETFSAMIGREPPLRLVLKNASSLFVNPADWRRFKSQGGVCYAINPMRLLAVTVNPYSPEGWEFPADEFLRAIERALAPLPVFNPAVDSG